MAIANPSKSSKFYLFFMVDIEQISTAHCKHPLPYTAILCFLHNLSSKSVRHQTKKITVASSTLVKRKHTQLTMTDTIYQN